MVVVSDGIVNCQVDAFRRIVCSGRRAHIVGGRLRAAEEINAKILGSSGGGSETICEVGIDPKSKAKMEKLSKEKDDFTKELAEVQLNIHTLLSIRQQRKSLPEDKAAYLQELIQKRKEIEEDTKKVNADIEKLEVYIAGLKTKGRVSASQKIYPGVKIIIQDVRQDIRKEYKAVTFTLQDGLLRVSKYEEPDEEAKKAPDGIAAD
jgi:uncharacterized protein (DUF342 family)